MPSKRDMERLVRGIEDAGDRLRASSVGAAVPPKDSEDAGAGAWLVISLKEGKNREIRRMMTAIGRKVSVLRRIRIGPLLLGTLGSGAFREVTDEEVDALYIAAGGKREGIDK